MVVWVSRFCCIYWMVDFTWWILIVQGCFGCVISCLLDLCGLFVDVFVWMRVCLPQVLRVCFDRLVLVGYCCGLTADVCWILLVLGLDYFGCYLVDLIDNCVRGGLVGVLHFDLAW